jgi:hypothetical protein
MAKNFLRSAYNSASFGRKVLIGAYATGTVVSGTYYTYVQGKDAASLFDKNIARDPKYYANRTQYDVVKRTCQQELVYNIMTGVFFPIDVAYRVVSFPVSNVHDAIASAIANSVVGYNDDSLQNYLDRE